MKITLFITFAHSQASSAFIELKLNFELGIAMEGQKLSKNLLCTCTRVGVPLWILKMRGNYEFADQGAEAFRHIRSKL
jgi:hypothetical protein